ncbi:MULTISPECIES: GerAB/ArcD/ProY family transporter [Bacillaceae]|uniref:Spore germination protein (Amino acid permease) n=1 Tax=Peribacillus huizhouensis TaxID=1501239 RepID=A0ABR6CQK9_9BACI|nr:MULTISPECIES: GerAB/ArcD/ProY family transporter [Bacillaceae]MBA9027310.1 spore germination protein (amino acid permease) [Peribacillus huizhouensis]
MQEQTIPDRLKISPFLIFYVIMAMQIGLGALDYQRIIAKDAGYDAWISIVFAGTCLHIIVWMIYKIAKIVNGDIVTAHMYVAGNLIGKVLSFPFIFYFLLHSLASLRTLFEILQVWIFPTLNLFWFSLGYMLLSMYVVFGGLRTVVGIAFFSLVLPAFLVFTFFPNLLYSNFESLLPIFDHSVKDLIKGSFHMSLPFIGFEVVLFLYPFIKESQKSEKWAHLGLLATTFLYTILAILTFAFFSEGQLQKVMWPTLMMWKIFKLSFVERFEFIGIAFWNLIILPNVCISIWIGSRLVKRIFKIRQKKGVYLLIIAQLGMITFIHTREEINLLNSLMAKVGFAFTMLYIPLLFIAVYIVKKVKKK